MERKIAHQKGYIALACILKALLQLTLYLKKIVPFEMCTHTEFTKSIQPLKESLTKQAAM